MTESFEDGWSPDRLRFFVVRQAREARFGFMEAASSFFAWLRMARDRI